MAPDPLLLMGCVSSLATSAAMVVVHLSRQRTERERLARAARLERERLGLAWRIFERTAEQDRRQDMGAFLAAIVRRPDALDPGRTASSDGAGAGGGP